MSINDVLEDANIKLSSVISDILEASGRLVLKALIDGMRDPERLADLGGERLGCSRHELVASLNGRGASHHGFMLAQHLRLV